MQTMKAFLSLILAGMVLLSGCGPSSSSGGSNSDKSGDGKGRPLTIGAPTEIVSMDIYSHGDHVTLQATTNMYNSLFKRQENGEIVNDLAESYQNIDDTTWEFTIKQGVTFHNGDQLTADDVKFTLERAATDKSLTENGTFKTIKEVKVMDDHKFQIVTNQPDPILLSVLARPGAGIYPKNYIEEKGWDYFQQHPVGTGPFKFEEWKRGSHISFVPFDNYYEGPKQNWSKLTFRIVPESSTRVNELLTGGLDLIPGVTSNNWERINNSDKTKLASSISQRVAFIVPRANEGSPTADKRVREAIELAIDNKAIIDTLLGGEATPTRTRVTPGNFGSNESLYDTSLYDVERAKQLLKEAGYEDGVELTLHSTSGRYSRDKEVAEMLVGMLAEAGIKVNLQLLEWSSYVELRNSGKIGDLHIVWLANSYYDAHIMVGEHLTSTRSMTAMGYDNPELAELLTQASTNMNQEERAKQYQRAQEIVAEERMNIYLYLEHNTYGVSKSVDFTPRLDERMVAYDMFAM
ncbi:ABC transporter substrate-binding protein [Paenibacillus sp. J2TS4]|uniref:ABC transporter substrate-binding protein n=1 Tax=Paenibacillus sp. J2TS4 TaxID=2807194 RepID=UPI001B1E9D1C|nr:ABC transporter substrate-binding protein [Paenibacillus sp. J2TS4]GIP33433.1 peptide ABC transporter substrate-binding protein [Paenibacillus sp. J2TS4]